MANLNVSNRMVQVLGNQDAQNLVNKILNDGKVDKTDKQDLQALEAMLKSAAEEDGTLDGEEKELIGALTNHSYVLGVNTGTSEAILLDNLKKVQQIQSKFKDMQPSEVAFDGLAITTDGFFSDEVRVVRLRDQIEAPTTQGEETQPAPTGTQTGATTGTTTPTETPSEGETVNETPDTANTPPAEEIDPIVPKTQYTPTTAPTAGTPSVEVPPEQAARVAPQEQAYTEAVQELQTEVRAVREMLNDPSQVSNEQLQTSLQSFAESDPTKALKELKRHNENILEDMKDAGLITDADINTLESSSSLTNQKLANGNKFGDVLAQYLKDTPLSDKQLNGYRETLVKAADNYIADPSNANKDNLRTELYDNLYVFEKGATPAQEEVYRKLSPALDQVDQKQTAFEQQAAVASGEASALSPQITSADELAKALVSLNSTPQNQIETFAGQMDKVLTYLDENPNQYEGQAEDAAALRSKVAELKSSQDPERKLALFNELKTDLDEIYIKTDIQKGADGVSQTETLAQLENLKATSSDPNVRQAADFLMQNPELLSNAPKVSEYKTILDSLNNGPQQLTPKQEELKAALESGDTAKVNQMYMNEMFDNMGGFMSSLGGMFGWGMSTPATPETQEPPLPGTWLGASELAETLQSVSPERRTELIQALQSPEATQLAQTLQNSPELSQIMGRYNNAQAAKNSIEQAHWSSNSGLEQTQEAIQNQQNQPTAIQTELENAQGAIDQLLSKGDLAAPVEARLKEQKASLDKALEMIKAGTFTPEVAQQADMAGLNSILSAINNNDSTPRLTMEQSIQRQATLDSLAELKNDPETMQKLENVLGDLKDEQGNLLYGHMFEKDSNGNYKFPDQMADLLNSDKLSAEGLGVAMHQVNRSLHVIDSAKTRSETTLRANLEQGKNLFESGQGERDFYSGFMALQNMNSIVDAASSSAYLSPEDIINKVAVNAQGLRGTQMSDAERRAAITQIIKTSTEQAKDAKLDNLNENNLSSIVNSDTISGLDSLFDSDDPMAVETRTKLLNEIKDISPNIDINDIQSAQDIFTKLNQSQIAELQSRLTSNTDETAAAREKLIEQLAQKGVQYSPGMSTQGHDGPTAEIIGQLNNLSAGTSNATRSSDSILQEAFSSRDMNAFVQAKKDSEVFVNDMNSNINSLTNVMDGDIAKVPGFSNFLSTQNIPPRPTNPQSPSYHREMAAYAKGVEDAAKAYMEQDHVTDAQRARLGVIVQASTNINVLSTVAFDVGSGGRIPPEHRRAVRDAAATTDLITQASSQLAAAGDAETAGEIQNELSQKMSTYTRLASQTDGAVVLPTETDQPGDHLNLGAAVTTGNAAFELTTAIDQNAQDFEAQGLPPLTTPPYTEALAQGEDIESYRPETEISSEMVLENANLMASTLTDPSPDEIIAIAQDILPSLQAQNQSWNSFIASADNYIENLNESRAELGMPPLETPVSDARASQGPVVIGSTAADQRAAELVDKANALADRLVLAPEGENSEEFLMELINGFIDTIRDQDYKTRQLILAQLANQMMTDSITNFYKDKTDKNNKYHQDSIARMAESFQRNIQRTIQESLVSQASDGQSIAAVSGQVGAANTAEAMGLEQLRASSEQLLSEAQKMTPPLITDLQKEKILESLFDNDPNNDAMGIIALAGLSIN